MIPFDSSPSPPPPPPLSLSLSEKRQFQALMINKTSMASHFKDHLSVSVSLWDEGL